MPAFAPVDNPFLDLDFEDISFPSVSLAGGVVPVVVAAAVASVFVEDAVEDAKEELELVDDIGAVMLK